MSSPLLTELEYDELLDYIDMEDIDNVKEKFVSYNLNIYDLLYDAPRYNDTGDEMLTYLDYAIAHNLTNIIDFCIENKYIDPNDIFLARCIDLHCIETYQYYIKSGCKPYINSLRNAIKLCYSEIVDNILTINNDISQLLLTEIDDEIIEYLFSFDIDEETLETVRALLNHNIDPVLFSKYLGYLKNQEDNYFKIAEDNQDLVIELIDILESSSVE
jgi:hypothetical protein